MYEYGMFALGADSGDQNLRRGQAHSNQYVLPDVAAFQSRPSSAVSTIFTQMELPDSLVFYVSGRI